MKYHGISLIILIWSLSLGKVNGQTLQSISEGVSVHSYGVYANWNSNSHFLDDIAKDDPAGMGFGIELRYGFNNMLSAYVSYGGVNFNQDKEWEDYKTALYRLGGQYNFGGSTSRMRPFINAGGVFQNFKLARIFLEDQGVLIADDAKLVAKGFAVEVGAGLKYHLIPEMVFELSVAGQFGGFGKNFIDGRMFEFEEKIDTQHIFVRFGVGYFFY